jgi:hypothetical protein
MASEEDNFDIDIYGDGEPEVNEGDYKQEVIDINLDGSNEEHQETQDNIKQEDPNTATSTVNGDTQYNESTTGTIHSVQSQQSTPAPQQGVKRKESSDDRSTDPGATTAILISDLHWWTTEDDVRGWANQAGCEDELRDVTFSEHKVNGKSKGYVLVRWCEDLADNYFAR